MIDTHGWIRLVLGVSLCALPIATLTAQDRRNAPGAFVGPFSGRMIINAPFTAIATTVVTQTRLDGARVRRTWSVRLFRNSAGHVRVDYDVPVGNGSAKKMSMLTVTGEDDLKQRVLNLDLATGTFRLISFSTAGGLFNATTSFAMPTGVLASGVPRFTPFITSDVHSPGEGVLEELGKAQVDGVSVIGLRVRDTKPVACEVCAGLPGMFTDERWESPELHVVVVARHIDHGHRVIAASYPGKAVDIDYRLTNIVRAEPSPDLFAMPPNYRQHWGGPTDPDFESGGRE